MSMALTQVSCILFGTGITIVMFFNVRTSRARTKLRKIQPGLLGKIQQFLWTSMRIDHWSWHVYCSPEDDDEPDRSVFIFWWGVVCTVTCNWTFLGGYGNGLLTKSNLFTKINIFRSVSPETHVYVSHGPLDKYYGFDGIVGN